MSLPSINLNVSQKLKEDPEFRQRFFLAEASAQIASQLIALRKRRDLSQTQLAEKVGTHQPAVSRVESADYRNWSFNTLRKLAEALDARLRIVIEATEDVLKEYQENDDRPAKPVPESRSIDQNALLPRQEDKARIPDQHQSSARPPLKELIKELPPRPYEQKRYHELQNI